MVIFGFFLTLTIIFVSLWVINTYIAADRMVCQVLKLLVIAAIFGCSHFLLP